MVVHFHPPLQLIIISNNNALVMPWFASPFLEVSTTSTISHYILGINVTNITKTISNPPGCRPCVSCNSSLYFSDPSFVIRFESNREQNTTILDYNGTIQFSFFAVNGAGVGYTTKFRQRRRRSRRRSGGGGGGGGGGR